MAVREPDRGRNRRASGDCGARQRSPGGHRWRYLFELKPGKGKRPVFLLPGGFGGDEAYLYYARLAYHVGADYPFYGLRARSAEGAMAAHRRVEEIAQDYLKEIRALQPQGPYSLMGNCIGGALAYEIARRLKAEREDCNLVLLDSFCPARKNYYTYLLREYGRRIDRFFRDQRRCLPARLREVFLERKMPRSGKSATAGIRRIQRRQESYVQILRGYRPRPYKGRVSLIYTEDSYALDPLGNRKVILNWQTESENNNTGFNVWRAERFKKINQEFIASRGTETIGAEYDFVDEWVLNGKRYFYWLENVDTNGISSFHGPVKAVPRWWR